VRTNDIHSGTRARTALLVTGSALLSVLGTLGSLYAAGILPPLNRQAAVRDLGRQIMPFDLDQTTHNFKTTDTGGIEMVIAKDPTNTEQIALIQTHLQHEIMRFRTGDFSDPTAIHGADMPGVSELAAGATNIQFNYTALSNGAQITYTTQDPRLIQALHRWFAAQLSDHGHDATGQ